MKEQHLQTKIINGKYQMVSKLKSGGFGSVYSAKCVQEKNKDVAIKKISSKFDRYAEIQRRLYAKIQQNKFTYGFIKNYDYFQQKQNIYLVLELLGKDLEDLMKKNTTQKFSLKTVLMIGLQVVDRLQAFHKIGYLHRDIKPENLLVGLKEKNKIIYLIDFGMARRIDRQRPEQKGKVLGSLAFMSCKAHEAKSVGPSDDIQSLLYSMLFMLTGTLPWLKIKIQKIADAHKILIMKTKISKESFQNNKVPQELFDILKVVKSAESHQKPDYLKVKFVFLQLLKKSKLQNDFQFDWCLKDNSKYQKKNVQSQKNIMEEKMQEQNQKIVQNQIYQIFKFMDKDKKPDTQQKKDNIAKRPNQQKGPYVSQKKVNQTQKKNNDSRPINRRIKDKEKQQMLTQVQLINSMQYSGPNIVINKTAKHKI